jgi:hypothetical protein
MYMIAFPARVRVHYGLSESHELPPHFNIGRMQIPRWCAPSKTMFNSRHFWPESIKRLINRSVKRDTTAGTLANQTKVIAN